ncbi:piggyBac transposable element-derived protein 4-like [Schistocerca nitens]|uniref:piggyBac transposable element-derived protein 4-like n=1 Tax=Schistocerca nitens TaxID=7011 RepID=UPI002117977D|nr:piggyBac transposable element-derived protein 4-like [Schistocerca nitens]XP_049816733.1 piggyBac transposable element-derived protein 4-like [Schistocerca nitens]
MARNYFDLSNPRHLEEIHELLMCADEEDPMLTENLGDESDIDSQDEVEEREDDSATEQDDDNTDEDEEGKHKNTRNVYVGRDNTTMWNKKPPKKRRRLAPHNIVTRLPGVIGHAKNAKTAVECWNALFTEDILDAIVRYTNQYIDTVQEHFSRARDISHTDVTEIRAFIGLLYLAGAYRGNRQSLEELWGTEGDGVEKFSLVMSLKRFKNLIRCLRFDDRTTRSQRKELDRLAPIREVFEKFVENCQKSYCAGENVTIDEMLPGFRGRCVFRQYIPSKPNKYGIKHFALVDAKMIYTLNMEVYVGQQPAGPFCVSNKPSEVVKRLAKPVFGSGRNITTDNWFTDFDLIDYLKTKKLSLVGTVRKNKRQIPSDFVDVKRREQHSSLFGFNDGKVLVSYVPRLNKNVILVSSLHNDDAIDPESGDKHKPEIVSFYNSTKGGVDTADQMCASYSVSRNTKRWPMVIFYTMLNVGGINSQVIYLGNQLEKMRRRVYLKSLAHQLVLGELHRRSMKTIGIPSSLQSRLKRFIPTEGREESPPTSHPKRRRCITCTAETGRRRMSNYECKKCQSAICLPHANMVCQLCFSERECVAPSNSE